MKAVIPQTCAECKFWNLKKGEELGECLAFPPTPVPMPPKKDSYLDDRCYEVRLDDPLERELHMVLPLTQPSHTCSLWQAKGARLGDNPNEREVPPAEKDDLPDPSVVKAERQIASLQTQLEELKEEHRLVHANANVENHKKGLRIAELEKELQEEKDRVQSRSADARQIYKEMEEAKRQAKGNKTDARQFSDALVERTEQLDRAEKRVKELEETVARVESEHVSQHIVANADERTLTTRIEQLEKTLAETEGALKFQRHTNNCKVDTIRDCRKRIAKLESVSYTHLTLPTKA